MVIVDEGGEIIVLFDVIGLHVDWNAHVCIVSGVHWGSEVKVFEVTPSFILP